MTKTVANDYTLTGDDTADTLVVQTLTSAPDTSYEYTFNLTGNGGDDRFQFFLADNLDATNATITGTFKGGTGTDTLELDFLGADSVNALKVGDHAFFTYSSAGSSGSFNADNTVERFVIKGSDNADVLIGSAGADWLDGRGGIDTFQGSAGDDGYVLDNSADRVIGEGVGGGKDTIWAGATIDLKQQGDIELLRLVEGSAIDGYGNGLANTITGNTQSNIIGGGAGNDSLYGKGGADTFFFGEKGNANKDTIFDFSSDDSIKLDASVFTGLDATGGVLDASDFKVSAAAVGAGAQILYNITTGNLSYDADGAGGAAAEVIGFVGKQLAFLDHSDILVM